MAKDSQQADLCLVQTVFGPNCPSYGNQRLTPLPWESAKCPRCGTESRENVVPSHHCASHSHPTRSMEVETTLHKRGSGSVSKAQTQEPGRVQSTSQRLPKQRLVKTRQHLAPVRRKAGGQVSNLIAWTGSAPVDGDWPSRTRHDGFGRGRSPTAIPAGQRLPDQTRQNPALHRESLACEEENACCPRCPTHCARFCRNCGMERECPRQPKGALRDVTAASGDGSHRNPCWGLLPPARSAPWEYTQQPKESQHWSHPMLSSWSKCHGCDPCYGSGIPETSAASHLRWAWLEAEEGVVERPQAMHFPRGHEYKLVVCWFRLFGCHHPHRRVQENAL